MLESIVTPICRLSTAPGTLVLVVVGHEALHSLKDTRGRALNGRGRGSGTVDVLKESCAKGLLAVPVAECTRRHLLNVQTRSGFKRGEGSNEIRGPANFLGGLAVSWWVCREEWRSGPWGGGGKKSGCSKTLSINAQKYSIYVR